MKNFFYTGAAVDVGEFRGFLLPRFRALYIVFGSLSNLEGGDRVFVDRNGKKRGTSISVLRVHTIN